MLTQDVRVHFQGFHPADKTEQRLQVWADELHEEGPSEACVKAVYSRHGKEYQGEIRITSRAGQFYASARGLNLYSVGRDVMKRMRRQLQKWKTTRFTHENLSAIPVAMTPDTGLGIS